MSTNTTFQAQINAALSSCEFFLSISKNKGDIFANLRVSPETQKKYPAFISIIIDLVKKFEGAELLWSSLPSHGWHTIQFTSTLKHYISLAGVPGHPGRCLPSNLPVHRVNTFHLLQTLVHRRDRMMQIYAIPSSDRSFSSPSVPTLIPSSVSLTNRTPNTPSFPTIPCPWKSAEEYPATGAIDIGTIDDRKEEQGSGRLIPKTHIAGLLPPVSGNSINSSNSSNSSDRTQKSDPWNHARKIEQLNRLTKAQIRDTYLPEMTDSQMKRTLKKNLIGLALQAMLVIDGK